MTTWHLLNGLNTHSAFHRPSITKDLRYWTPLRSTQLRSAVLLPIPLPSLRSQSQYVRKILFSTVSAVLLRSLPTTFAYFSASLQQKTSEFRFMPCVAAGPGQADWTFSMKERRRRKKCNSAFRTWLSLTLDIRTFEHKRRHVLTKIAPDTVR